MLFLGLFDITSNTRSSHNSSPAMIIVDDDNSKKQPPPATTPTADDGAGPSTLVAELPPFEAVAGDPALVHNFSDTDVFVPPGGEAPPPEFAPYEAEYFETSDGTVVSHDRHLNEDGAHTHPDSAV